MNRSTWAIKLPVATVAGVIALLVFTSANGTTTAPADPEDSPVNPDATIREFASRFCYSCHGTAKQRAEINLEAALDAPGGLTADSYLLEDFIRVVKDGDMPPRTAKVQPTAKDRADLLTVLEGVLAKVQAAQVDDPGVVVVPRLTRQEYRHIIRDLSGGIVADAGRLLPNEGGAGEGFANVGEAQGMTAQQFEKYLEAGRDALRYLRVDPVSGMVWRPVPREPVNEPAQARQEAVNDVIAWYVAEQEQLGSPHRDNLKEKLDLVHAAYLEAAWHYHWRKELGQPQATITDIARTYEVPLAPVALEKWYAILTSDQPEPPFTAWATAWKALPAPADDHQKTIRQACREIESGARSQPEKLEYGPHYELSWSDPQRRAQTLTSARDGFWPFDIDIGPAQELYLIMTDAGDGSNREIGTWHAGRIHFVDGTIKPWQDVVRIIGASSGRDFPFGKAADGGNLPSDSLGVKPPGAVKFAVPDGAVRFEVTLTVDRKLNPNASVQALVLRDAPKKGETSFYPDRPIFGGKTVQLTHQPVKQAKGKDPLNRYLNRRNLAVANRTKIGLNAERNVLANWTHTDPRYIGGPWPDHDIDRIDPMAPYHLTAEQVRLNATSEALADLTIRSDRLAALAQVPHQDLKALLEANGVELAKEGVVPAIEVTRDWLPDTKEQFLQVRAKIHSAERRLEGVAEQLLEQFATKAWRRPLTTAEMQQLLDLYRKSRQQGDSFDGAMKTPLLVTLVSPHFLYRLPLIEFNSGKGDVRELTSLELASRLASFLWASIPDDELLRLAKEDRLQDPQILVAQARRMLRDERARALTTTFAAQIYRFAEFDAFTGPDHERFPEFDPDLRRAMLDEVIWFFDDLFRMDRPLTNLIRSDYTYVNARLAGHYNIQGVTGDIPQRVKVPSNRGGLTGMALFQTQSSLPLRTSPVQRGNWVLEDLLGRRLPDPPADIPPLSDDERNDRQEGIREQLARHRANATCAACHNKIDPLGIALENFDPIGRWRTTDRAGQDVMASATTHDGVELDGIDGLQDYLESRQDEVFTHFNRKLLGYALGRAVIPGDAKLLNRMAEVLQSNEYRLSAVIEVLVNSPQFRLRRTEGQR